MNDSAVQLNLTVPENDSPYGILEFYYTVPPATGVIPPATDIPQINTDESAGTVTVYVVRAQGTVGVASVDYLAQDGTASSGGVSPDYSPAGSTLEFSNGERFKSFTVTLVDDSTPELSKYFFVNLSHPVGNAGKLYMITLPLNISLLSLSVSLSVSLCLSLSVSLLSLSLFPSLSLSPLSLSLSFPLATSFRSC